MKIVVSGAARQMNLGGPSIFHGIAKVFRQVFPGCEMVYHEIAPVFSGELERDPDYPDIRVCRGNLDAKKLIWEAGRRRWLGGAGSVQTLERRLIEEIRAADLFVDAWGIDFTDRLSQMNFRGALLAKPLIRIASWFGIPAVHYTASYGPMNRRWVRLAARRVLGRQCALVYCRETRSREILSECGVRGPKLLVAPDTGFLMPSRPVILDGLDSARPCLGVSVSHQIIRQWKSPTPYLEMIAQLCDRAIQQWNAQVVLIPNELSDQRYDDRAVARDVLERVRGKGAVHLFPAERHSGPEQKGAIAQCDLFVASRYHSIVAAMSQAVPTVVIGWHHKYAELLEKFGQTDVGLSSETCNFELLWERCENLWSRRRQVSADIRSALPAVENSIYQAGERLRSLFT
jgi:polysaccharide pyruvyl transferase WcaK-like protein